MSSSGISWAICKMHLTLDIIMPAPHHSVFLQAGCPSCHPTNCVKEPESNNTITQKLKNTKTRLNVHAHACVIVYVLQWDLKLGLLFALNSCGNSWLAICHPSGCTVASGIVIVVSGSICNCSQMRTSKRTCLIFGVSIGLDPG